MSVPIVTWMRATAMSSGWISVDDTLPLPGEIVLRYGKALLSPKPPFFLPYIDRGELVNRDGFRWADWGVTHWIRLP